MKAKTLVSTAILIALSSIAVACSQATPAPAATQPPAAPTKAAATAAEPTKAAAPTTAPAAATSAPAAAKTDYPAKGKAITLICAFQAGGASDIAARQIAPLLEKELGVPVQVVNKGGANGQVGYTEIFNAKPDGYTIGQPILPGVLTSYLDPERKAIYKPTSFPKLGNHFVFPYTLSVKADSPYKTLKDLVDAAKEKPGTIKAGTVGVQSGQHLVDLQLAKATDTKLAIVHFEGGAPELTALLGGHIDLSINQISEVAGPLKAGQLRVLAVTGKEEAAPLPGVKTVISQGYDVYVEGCGGLMVPPGTPKEITDVLTAAVKKSVADPEHQKKLSELGFIPKFMEPAQQEAYWSEIEKIVTPLMPLTKDK